MDCPRPRHDVGYLAWGLWDRERRELTLVRDRLGEKPLHWAPVGRGVAFADYDNDMDLDALVTVDANTGCTGPGSIDRPARSASAGAKRGCAIKTTSAA